MFACGAQSIRFPVPVFVRESASIVGKKEGEGPLGEFFDVIGSDELFGGSTWEEAESCLQRDSLHLAVKKAGLHTTDIRYLFAGDLLGQGIATSFGLMQYERPLFGLYGACSTCGLSLTLASMAISGGFTDIAACVTSSHFASAEKEFRFPLGYGNQRPLSATWTVTGSAAFILSSSAGSSPRALITGVTPGKIVDYGLRDSMNMGACMAPAAADTIARHLDDFKRSPADYDRIITGDLGQVGQRVLLDLLSERGIELGERHTDCGIEIFDCKKQDTHAGGSGCGCSAVVLSAFILRQLFTGRWRRVLFVPTGALLSKTSFNEGQTVPGIAHAVVLESPLPAA
ncbi:MAG: stage V sporulation protein AD [Eubacteriales bacterium]|nr:stage V sporulation protein AD [Eubacteriales bacterium]